MKFTRTLISLWIFLSLTSNINLEPMIRYQSLGPGNSRGVQVDSDSQDVSSDPELNLERHQFIPEDSEATFLLITDKGQISVPLFHCK